MKYEGVDWPLEKCAWSTPFLCAVAESRALLVDWLKTHVFHVGRALFSRQRGALGKVYKWLLKELDELAVNLAEAQNPVLAFGEHAVEQRHSVDVGREFLQIVLTGRNLDDTLAII